MSMAMCREGGSARPGWNPYLGPRLCTPLRRRPHQGKRRAGKAAPSLHSLAAAGLKQLEGLSCTPPPLWDSGQGGNGSSSCSQGSAAEDGQLSLALEFCVGSLVEPGHAGPWEAAGAGELGPGTLLAGQGGNALCGNLLLPERVFHRGQPGPS